MITVGVTGLAPATESNTVLGWPILQAKCLKDGDAYSPMTYVGVWLLLSTCGSSLQFYLGKRDVKMTANTDPNSGNGSLADSLLPEANAQGGGAGLTKPQKISGQMTTYTKIRDAIHNPEADLSEFSAHEKQIVEACRTDEEERDRL